MVAVEMRRIETERLAPERIVKLEAAVPLGNGDAIRKYMAVIFSGLLCFSGVVLVVASEVLEALQLHCHQKPRRGLR